MPVPDAIETWESRVSCAERRAKLSASESRRKLLLDPGRRIDRGFSRGSREGQIPKSKFYLPASSTNSSSKSETNTYANSGTTTISSDGYKDAGDILIPCAPCVF